MNEEVRESPTIRFDARKQSVNAPTQNKATFVNYSKILIFDILLNVLSLTN